MAVTCNRTPWGADSRRNGLKVLHGRGGGTTPCGLILSIALLSLSACQVVQVQLGYPGAGRHHPFISTHPFHSHYVYIEISTGIVYAASADTGPNSGAGHGNPRMARGFLPYWLIHRRKGLLC